MFSCDAYHLSDNTYLNRISLFLARPRNLRKISFFVTGLLRFSTPVLFVNAGFSFFDDLGGDWNADAFGETEETHQVDPLDIPVFGVVEMPANHLVFTAVGLFQNGVVNNEKPLDSDSCARTRGFPASTDPFG